MNLLDRLLNHDRTTTAQLLALALPLADEHLDREFDLGLRTLRTTLDHTVRNVEVWTAIMRGDGVPERIERPNIGSLIERFETAYDSFADLAQHIETRNEWDETWLDILEDPPVERTFGGTIAHVITHSMHHRTQILFMLRRLGVEGVPEGDALSCEEGAGA